MFNRSWKERALAAEAAALELANAVELRLKERAVLVSITREGKHIKFIFARNNDLFTIKAMGTWDDDLEAWKRDLFE